MPPKALRVESEHTLLPFLFEQFPELKRGDIKRMLKFGSVSVNGLTATRHDKPLAPGDEVTVDREHKKNPQTTLGLDIVHQDPHLIVINKPAGLLSVATPHEREKTAQQIITDYIQAHDRRHGRRVYVVHRLDRETSGLLMFARNERTLKKMQETWKDVEKHYYAVVEGIPREENRVITSYLIEDENFRVRSVPPSDEARLAVTEYRILRKRGHRALLDVELETGRKNQIRVQLADIGHPIVGDTKYGNPEDKSNRMALHAYRLVFTHPTTGERLEFETPLPKALERLLGA